MAKRSRHDSQILTGRCRCESGRDRSCVRVGASTWPIGCPPTFPALCFLHASAAGSSRNAHSGHQEPSVLPLSQYTLRSLTQTVRGDTCIGTRHPLGGGAPTPCVVFILGVRPGIAGVIRIRTLYCKPGFEKPPYQISPRHSAGNNTFCTRAKVHGDPGWNLGSRCNSEKIHTSEGGSPRDRN